MKIKNFHMTEEELNISDSQDAKIDENMEQDAEDVENQDEHVSKKANRHKRHRDKYDEDLLNLHTITGTKENPYELSFEEHKEKFLKLNSCNEYEFDYLFKKLKRKKYISFEKIEDCNFNIPHGECIGKTMMKKKVYSKKPAGYFKSNDKVIPYYDILALDTNIVGYIPVGDNYILVTKRKKSVIDVAVAFLGLVYAINFIL